MISFDQSSSDAADAAYQRHLERVRAKERTVRMDARYQELLESGYSQEESFILAYF